MKGMYVQMTNFLSSSIWGISSPQRPSIILSDSTELFFVENVAGYCRNAAGMNRQTTDKPPLYILFQEFQAAYASLRVIAQKARDISDQAQGGRT
jgi:hypothetical protein